jgi:ribonuclease P protein subunit POP4
MSCGDGMRKRSNLGQHELIGLDIEVITANDKGLVGLKGRITDETKNTLLIAKGDKEIRMPKMGTVIRITTQDEDIELDCSNIMFRPEDRIKRVKG